MLLHSIVQSTHFGVITPALLEWCSEWLELLTFRRRRGVLKWKRRSKSMSTIMALISIAGRLQKFVSRNETEMSGNETAMSGRS